MQELDQRPPELEPERDAPPAGTELLDSDLECVVGGLARPWTDVDGDERATDARLL